MIDKYRERVKNAAEARKGEPLYNGSLDHAAVLAEAMFQHAQKEVCILSGELNARVYGRADVVEQANLFLADPDHTAKILVESESALDWENHPLLKAISDNGNAEVKVVPENVRGLYNFHFIVMDSDSYRFEKDRGEPVAIAAFGDKKGGENMRNIFSTLWNSSKSVARNH
ncbi:MAG: hypothetical protein K0M49_15370 [Arenimonas sp.]|nr:hypothetical protein [Rhizobium sp.]MBW8446999.1 hypothetical protein [Arenimonas sp.]